VRVLPTLEVAGRWQSLVVTQLFMRAPSSLGVGATRRLAVKTGLRRISLRQSTASLGELAAAQFVQRLGWRMSGVSETIASRRALWGKNFP